MIVGEFSLRPVLVVVLVGFDECDDEANGTRWGDGQVDPPEKLARLMISWSPSSPVLLFV